MEGKTARGASSPAKPALHIPEPLSTTRAAISSSMAVNIKRQSFKTSTLIYGLSTFFTAVPDISGLERGNAIGRPLDGAQAQT